MKKTIFAKYNRTRRPEYQVCTRIFEDEEGIFAEKEALTEDAAKHIEDFSDKYLKLKNLYNNLNLLEPEIINNRVVFNYVKGKTIDSILENNLADLNLLIKNLKDIIGKIFTYKDENYTLFRMTEKFSNVFGNIEGLEKKALKVSNIDIIFDNIILLDEKLYSLDYEWVFDFPIPANFCVYRSLFFFFNKHRKYLEQKINEEDFLLQFGLDSYMQSKYAEMEEGFQQHVHGKDRCYIYTNRYRKNIKTMDYFDSLEEEIIEDRIQLTNKDNHIKNIENKMSILEQVVDMKETHIQNLEKKNVIYEESIRIQNCGNEINEKNLRNKDIHINNLEELIRNQNKYIDKVHQAIKNPFYGVLLVMKKIMRKLLPHKVLVALYILKNEGLFSLLYKVKLRRVRKTNKISTYEEWINENEQDINQYRNLTNNPLISIIVPVYNVLDEHLIACIESVKKQTYKNWELCLADDASTWSSVKEVLKSYEGDRQIKIVYRKENGHISRASNSAIKLATGEYIAFLDCDDVLSHNALYEMGKKLNEDPEYDFIYSDEDKIDDDGNNRHMPHFKPDWSPDTMMSHMYTCHFSLYRKSIVDEIGGLRIGYEGAQDYDFTLRFTEKTNKIGHIPKILYHWRERPESTAIDPTSKPYILEAARKSKEDALVRRGLTGKLELIDNIYQFRVNYLVTGNPLVSIIIPTKDNFEIYKRCVETVKKNTIYKNYEIVTVDNGSNNENKKKYEELCKGTGVYYHYKPMEFNFSRMCNEGCRIAKGDYYLFLNDDIEIIQNDWIDRMLGHASLEHAGAVGVKLLYPDSNNIQHDGVININQGPVHSFAGFDDNIIYYFGRNRMEYNYSAVTAACVMVNKAKFKLVGGFDEKFAVTYNDVDLCFSLIENGYYNVVRNDVILYHHESISRGNDILDDQKLERLKSEQKNLYNKHPLFRGYDRFYNINLTQNKADCSIMTEKISQFISFSNLVTSKKTYNMVNNEKISGNLDVLVIGEHIEIEGWVVKQKSKFNNFYKKVVVLQNASGETVLVDTEKRYRPDVASEYGNGKMLFTGFACSINPSQLKYKNYSIGILIYGIAAEKFFYRFEQELIVL